MVLDDQDWQLPQIESIQVNDEELLLLDWVLGSASGLLPGATLEDLMSSWSPLRLDLWKGIRELKRSGANGIFNTTPLLMDESTARILLAIVPTTFRWGTGPDCGYSLKTKLYLYLIGEQNEERQSSQDQTSSNSQDSTPGTTGSDA